MKHMKLNDGPGWSPDGGQFWVKGDMVYWHDGDVADLNQGGVFRTMDFPHTNDFSSWSDEKRSAVRAEWAEKRRLWKLEEEQEEARVNALRESALAKLTEDEARACGLA